MKYGESGKIEKRLGELQAQKERSNRQTAD